MKTRFNQMIVSAFLIIFLISGNVVAKETELVVVSNLENVEEPKLELENWMVNEYLWHTSNNTYVVEEVQEENLLTELWMLDINKWDMAVFNYSTEETEHTLMIENWMLNEMYWN